MNLGPPEIIGIVVLALLLFGGRKLPELGSSVGKTITNFRKGLSEAKEEEAAEKQSQTATVVDPATGQVVTGQPISGPPDEDQ